MQRFVHVLTGALALVAMITPLAHAEPPPNPHTILAEVGKVVSANGIDQARAVEIGGIRQWITVRGRDRHNPILLLLHGGPPAPDLPNRYLFEGSCTDYFTVVEWDQRGAGKTYELNAPETVAPTMHADRMVQDTEERRLSTQDVWQQEDFCARPFMGHDSRSQPGGAAAGLALRLHWRRANH